MLRRLRSCKLSNDVEKTTLFQHRNNVVLFKLNQRQNLTLKQR